MSETLVPQSFGPYEILSVLGSGAFGDVYEAQRMDDGRHVALKILRDYDATAVRELKHEARILWSLPVPGLAVPSELGVVDGIWYVALPRVRGVRLDRLATQRLPASDRKRTIAGAIRSVAQILANLHAQGVLHLDLKPANVFIGDSGDATLLDFGFSRWLENPPAGMLGPNAASRPPLPYCAPELLCGEVPSAAADCYSLGCIVHELLFGEPPHTAWSRSPFLVRPRGMLEQLCSALLLPRASDRPTAQQAAEVCAAEASHTRRRVTRRCPMFAGRLAELDALVAATDATSRGIAESSNSSLVLLLGAAGYGKTRLVAQLSRALGSRGCKTLLSRCFENDRTPYAVITDVLSDLPGAHFSHQESEGLRQGMQSEAEGALELSRRLRDRMPRPLTWMIEDAQWLDADSIRALAGYLASPEAERTIILLTARSDAASRQILDLVRSSGAKCDFSKLELAPMGTSELAEIARHCNPSLDVSGADRIASASDGSPFIAELLASCDGVAPRDAPADEIACAVVAQEVARMDEGERLTLEFLAVAGRPIRESALIYACRASGLADPSVEGLRVASWVQSCPGDGAHVALFHTILRGAVVATIPEERMQHHHIQLLAALTVTGAPAQERFLHAAALGQHDDAIALARQAADDALRATAPEAEAEWLRQVRQIEQARGGLPDLDLARREWRAWYAAGRPLAAASTQFAIADATSGASRSAALLRAADGLFVSGEMGDAATTLVPLTTEAGVPTSRSTAAALLSSLAQLLFLRAPTLATLCSWPLKPSSRAALLWILARGLSYAEPLRSLDYALLSLRAAIKERDPRLTATLLAFVGGGVLHQIGPLRKRGATWLDSAAAWALHACDTETSAVVSLWRTVRLLDSGALAAAREGFLTVLAGLHAVDLAHWERLTARQSMLWIEWRMGNFTAVRSEATKEMASAAAKGDRLATVVFSQFLALANVPGGDPSAALENAAWIRREWSAKRFTVQTFYAALTEAMAQLALGRRERAVAAWTTVQRPFARAGGNHAAIVAIENLEMKGRLLIHLGAPARKLRSVVDRLRGFARPHSTALALWLECAATNAGTDEFTTAAEALRACGLQAAADGIELQILGHSADPRLYSRLLEKGIVDPQQWSRTFYPISSAVVGRSPK